MFYIKLIDKNYNNWIIYYYCTQEFNSIQRVIKLEEKDNLIKLMNGYDNPIGCHVVDDINYIIELSLKINDEWKHLLLLNNVEGYIMNEQGQTIDRI